jgi:hypothetical protein
MINKKSYPFNLTNSFFICLDIQRGPEVPPNLVLAITTEIKVVDIKFPDQFQVNLKVNSQNDDPIKFSLELVGLFSYTGNQPELDKNKFIDFLNDQGLYMMWPHLTHMLRFLSAQMGMQVLNLNMAPELYINPDLLSINTQPK